MTEAEDARLAGTLSISYMMAIAGRILRSFPLDLMDMLVVTTIANFNAAATTEPPPKGRRRAGALAPKPNVRGVSRNAVSRTLNVPLETVRRRIAGLLKQKILREQHDGLVFTADNPIGLGNNADLAAFNMEMLRLLFRNLKAHGIKLD